MKIETLANNQVVIHNGDTSEFHSYGTRIAVKSQHAPTRLDPK